MKHSNIDPTLNASNYYLIGIKGVGMTALAQCLLDRGALVRGCDVAEEFVTQPTLEKRALQIDTEENPVLPADCQCLVYGGAHNGLHHPLVIEAQRRNCLITSQAKLVGALSKQKKTLSVCGVGGKSTTSALLAWILDQAKLQPSYLVGVGEIIGMSGTGRWNEHGEYFAVEADEYAENPLEVSQGANLIPRFHYLEPQLIICTNLFFDHPDVYKNSTQTQQTFYDFFLQLRPNGTLIWNYDDAALPSMLDKFRQERPDVHFISFGSSAHADVVFSSVEADGLQSQFRLSWNDSSGTQKTIELSTSLPGKYNLANCAAAWAASKSIGIAESITTQAMASFLSTTRRFQIIRSTQKRLFIDDYAHHPHEIQSVLETCRSRYPDRKLVAIFQPHTYSRTASLLQEFAEAFSAADKLILVPIFGSARESVGTVSSQSLADAIQQSNPKLVIEVVADLKEAAQMISKLTLSPCTIITIGAGDVYKIHSLLDKDSV